MSSSMDSVYVQRDTQMALKKWEQKFPKLKCKGKKR